MQGDVICAEFITKESPIYILDSTSTEARLGDFVVIGVGPGVPYESRDPDSKLVPVNYSVGDKVFFQNQDAYMFKHDNLPGRNFAMVRATRILAKWKPSQKTVVEKILALQ